MHLLFLKRHWVLIGGATVIFLIATIGGKMFFDSSKQIKETAIVQRGDVSVLVSVSGTLRTPNTATLGFPGSGIIDEILVREGDTVSKGQILGTLKQSGPLADYNDALAYLSLKEASRDELVAGPRNEARDVTKTTVAIAKAEISRIEKEQDELVASAVRTLYSTNIIAKPKTTTLDDTPPIISGTYLCTEPQTYRFLIYRSGSHSGFSYRIIEGDTEAIGTTESAVTETATPFGNCGLYIQFVANQTYGTNEWSIEIPNKQSASYDDNLNAYTIALQNRENALEAAQQNLTQAEQQALVDTAQPRTEELARADAEIAQARARLKAAEAKIADYTIRAPFDGIITAVNSTPGEVSNTSSGIIITADDAYELKIRVPEIDITRLEQGDHAIASFDAKPEERVPATITFVSPLPTEIDGVSYYEAYLALNTTPSWVRTGLNADVDVTIDSATNTLVVPKRFIQKNEGISTILVDENGSQKAINVETGLEGNDGFVEIFNVAEGATVIAP